MLVHYDAIFIERERDCIAGNFQGRKLSQILWFCGFFFSKIGDVASFSTIHENFLPNNCIFHPFVKVFSLESFPLINISYTVPI